jgi:hypothetical protein
MSRCIIPLRSRTLYASGDVLVWAEIFLLLKDRFGNWRREMFRVDTGSEMTVMLAENANQLDLREAVCITRGNGRIAGTKILPRGNLLTLAASDAHDRGYSGDNQVSERCAIIQV